MNHREKEGERGRSHRDMAAGKQAQQRLNLAANIIDSSNEGIIITDVRGIIADVNEAFCNLTGYTREEVIGRKINDALTQPVKLNGREVFVGASIGITLYPPDGLTPDRLLQNADMALYRAKELGKNTFQFFSSEMNREVGEELELEQSLRRALESGEFLMYYQPKVDCRTGRIHGVEAFMRWVHPTRGLRPRGTSSLPWKIPV